MMRAALPKMILGWRTKSQKRVTKCFPNTRHFADDMCYILFSVDFSQSAYLVKVFSSAANHSRASCVTGLPARTKHRSCCLFLSFRRSTDVYLSETIDISQQLTLRVSWDHSLARVAIRIHRVQMEEQRAHFGCTTSLEPM